MGLHVAIVAIFVNTDDTVATMSQLGTLLKPYKAPDTRGDIALFDPFGEDNHDLGLVLEDLQLPGAAKTLYALQEQAR